MENTHGIDPCFAFCLDFEFNKKILKSVWTTLNLADMKS